MAVVFTGGIFLENISSAKNKKKKSKKGLIIALVVIVLIIAVGIGRFALGKKQTGGGAANVTYTEGAVQRRTIQTTMSSSGTLQPADSYTVTSLVSGDILECNFEEGDVVNKDDVLYLIDSSDMENTIERAQISYDKVVRSYDKIVESLEDLKVYSDYNGIITDVFVEEGDSIQAGTKIASLRDDSVMHITVPFAAADARALRVGDVGSVIIDGSYERFDCTIDELDSFDSVLGDRIVRYVKASVANTDGGIHKINTATVTFGDYVCLEKSSFEYNKEATITAKVAGDVVSIVKKGAQITADETLVCELESETLENNFKDAKSSLDDAKLSFDNTKEKLDDYTVTAPITGTVIEKYSKVGDTLDSSRGQTAMAIIYDLSYLQFDMALDELDISRVEVGQKVILTCDAISMRNIEGEITKVSVVGTTSYNSTSYPVTVKVYNPPERLLAGMNVDAELVIEEAANVLAIPSAAVQRGNVVYVKDDGTKTENDTAPEGYMSVRVETGLSNENYIEIKDTGVLKEGDTVCIPQAVRAITGMEWIENAMNGRMPSMGGGQMPNMGGGNFSGGQRPSGGNFGGGQMPGGLR